MHGTLTSVRERRADLVVVGGGIVGLAHAWHARRAGLEVLVVERDEFAVGASIRNFGHVCTTAQAGLVLELARAAREDWLTIAADGGVPVRTDGTVVLARTEAERAVLEQFAADRGSDEVRLLDPHAAAARLGFAAPGLLAAAHLPLDLRVNAPTAIPAIAAHLETIGVDFLRRTTVHDVGEEIVRTARGPIRAERIVVAVGHDVDRFFPDLADEAGVRRCRLRMLEVDPPEGIRVPPAVLTGLSMLRYDGLSEHAGRGCGPRRDRRDGPRAAARAGEPHVHAATRRPARPRRHAPLRRHRGPVRGRGVRRAAARRVPPPARRPSSPCAAGGEASTRRARRPRSSSPSRSPASPSPR